MFATVCRSCDTINRYIIISRCKYCGSQRLDFKSIDDSLVKQVRNREVLLKPVKVKNASNP